jgi:hypothetical protein
MRDGGDYQTRRNHLTQPKPGKQFLNNVTDTGKIEMQKNKGIVEIMKQVHITKKIIFYFKKVSLLKKMRRRCNTRNYNLFLEY